MRAKTCFAASLLALLLLTGCSTLRPARPCAEIPLPVSATQPQVVLPKPEPDGRFCLTPDQIKSIREGIVNLRMEIEALKAVIALHNAEAK